VLLLAATAPVYAQPGPTPPDKPAPAIPENANDAEAKKLYKDGDRRYAEGRYEEAIRNFERAYALSKRPLILFAIANTYERMGEYEKARQHLQRFVLDSPSGDVDAVRQRIRQLEKRVAARKAFDAEIAKLRARPIECKEKVCPVYTPPPASSKLPIVFWATGGVAAVSAVIFGTVARGAHNDAKEGCGALPGSKLCSAASRSDIDRERRFALLTDISIGLTVISAGVGTYLWMRDRKRKARERRFAITPTHNGVAIVGGF
jgi:hypothetical protein